jgi:hypothetical protein
MFARLGVWVLGLALIAGAGSSLGTTLRQARRVGEFGAAQFTNTFTGGERACVIAIGDHRPPSPMEIRVFDAKNVLIAEAHADTDTGAVIWYPQVTAEYRIEIRNLGGEYNDMMIYFQGAVKR